ncbi:MAG: hypothetical protein WBP94_09060 [Rhodomicrobiaceae bacterium]
MRIATIALLIAFSPTLAAAAPPAGNDPDWPCIQREIPQISAGMVWAGGPLDPDDQSWSADPLVAPKVSEVSSRRKTVEEAIAAIDAFAAGLKDDRARLLTALFTGVLQRINVERSQILAGIKRYARKQAALANAIKDKSIERAKLASEPSPSPEAQKRRADLDEQLTWDDRIYQERQQSLRYVCETPVLLEQRLFQIGRHISQLVSQN